MANSLTKPSALANTFCNSGDKRSIPTSATGTNAASLIEGFPAITSTPVAQGGIPPERLDFNGVLNLLSQYCYFLQNGGTFNYDSNVASAIGGYPQGAILNYTDSYGNTIQIRSLVNNNTSAPSSSNIKTPVNSGGDKWEIVSNKMTGLFLTNPNATTETYNGYAVLSLNQTGYLKLVNVIGIFFSDFSAGITVTNGQMNIFGAGLQINSNPVMRIPDYSTKTQVAISDSNNVSSWTATFDGWVEAEVYIEYMADSNDCVFSINDKSIYTRRCDQNRYGVLGLYPIKAGDVIKVRRGIRAFSYSYR